ncbi:DUF6152 family protein [Paracoccus tegillarcae]|nr:DUF6152 family protein [Paracoccus tegillarcae]
MAHHGWRWTTGRNIRLSGLIASANLGNPHGVLRVDAEGDQWMVEVGQPWRNQRAGLTDSDFATGREIVIEGEPSANLEDRLLKAERIWFDGKLHDLYPERG